MPMRQIVLAAAALAISGCAYNTAAAGDPSASYASDHYTQAPGHSGYSSDHDRYGDPERSFYEDGNYPG